MTPQNSPRLTDRRLSGVYMLHIRMDVGARGNLLDRIMIGHYVGFSSDIHARFRQHANGKAGPTTRRYFELAARFKLGRIWTDASHAFERYVQLRRHFLELCPLCLPDAGTRLSDCKDFPHLPGPKFCVQPVEWEGFDRPLYEPVMKAVFGQTWTDDPFDPNVGDGDQYLLL